MSRRSGRALASGLALGGFAALVGVVSAVEAGEPFDERESVQIRFAAQVGDQPFACGTEYGGIGRSAATILPTEMRFFVSAVELVAADGRTVPVDLDVDGLWQSERVALLDFENGTGPCVNGNAPTREVVTGTVPAGEYVGLRFDVGVPFEDNHLDLTTQPSPLSLSRMFWAWNSGHKFMRVDLRVGDGGWMIHLGSTHCTPRESATSTPDRCEHPNRPTIELPQFDADEDVVVFDLAALLADADVSRNTEGTAGGCMSSQDDPECAPLFASLGLAHGDRAPVAQSAFRVVAGVAAEAAPPR